MENNLIPIKENFFQKLYRLFKKIFTRKEKSRIESIKIDNTYRQKNHLESSKEDEFFNSLRTAELKKEEKEKSNDDEHSLIGRFRALGYEFEEEEFVDDINKEEDRKEFLKVYSDLENNTIDLKKIKAIDLIRINYILERKLKGNRNNM